MKMTKHLLSLIGAAAMVWTAGAVTITLDKVQQRYPWNNLVDIDYTLSDDLADGAVFNVTASIDGTDFKASSFTTPFATTKGQHRATWNTEADGYKVFSKNVTFGLTVTIFGTPDYDTVYVDLDTGKVTTEKVGTLRADVDAAAEGTLTEAEYAAKINIDENKTNKLVFRVIPSTSFTMVATNWVGTSQRPNIKPHTVTLSPHLIGVFEVTQGQWNKVMGGYRGNFIGGTRDKRPCDNVSWNMIRGAGLGNTGGESGGAYDWPLKGHTVGADSFCGKLRAKVAACADNSDEFKALEFDLPTEAQLYYATYCGRTTIYPGSLNTPGSDVQGSGTSATYCPYARVQETIKNGSGNTATTGTLTPDEGGTAYVGSYQVNSLGLYDTIGNVMEWVLDWMNYVEDYACVDPTGMTTSSISCRIYKGGSWRWSENHCTAFRCQYEPSYFGNGQSGFRLASAMSK